jgi:hypothetical protein
MKQRAALLSLVLPLLLVACDRGTPVIIQAQVEQNGQPTAIENLPFEILPYDRDAVFDSLEAAYSEPEPAIPPEMLAQQQQVQQAQSEWRAAEERWGQVRERLREIAAQMERMQREGQRATPQYQALFREFEQLEPEERQLQQRMNQSFARFDQLQRGFIAQADSIRIAREAWAERAFADYDRVVDDRLNAERRNPVADTTRAGGVQRVRVGEGNWWVYARYTLPFSELYWNVPITVRGDSVVVQLNEATAEARPVF